MSCEQHKKEVAGISDMKVLAEMIGDLHYETLAEFLKQLANKLSMDSHRDFLAGKEQLSISLRSAHYSVMNAYYGIDQAWQISKPFMLSSEQNVQVSDTTDDAQGGDAGKQKT